MIVVAEPDGSLLVVRQDEHAELAAQMARCWRRPVCLPEGVWERFLRAVRQHDAGWKMCERFPALDPATGSPYDFIRLPTMQHTAIWRRSIDLAEQTDAYVALLVAQHARYLYTTHARETDPQEQRQVQIFLNETAARIDGYIRKLEAGSQEDRQACEPHNLAVAARLLRAFDYASLSLLGAVPWTGLCEKLRFGDQEANLRVRRLPDQPMYLRVEPWPFESERVNLRARAQRLKRTQFADSADLVESLSGAQAVELEWTFLPG